MRAAQLHNMPLFGARVLGGGSVCSALSLLHPSPLPPLPPNIPDFQFTCMQNTFSVLLLFYFCLFFFLGPHGQHMEVPRLGVESECSCQPTP